MIARVEAGAVQPTAALLGRLARAFGLRSSRGPRAHRRGWRVRPTRPSGATQTPGMWRALSPPADTALQLTLVDLPAGATVHYPVEAYAFIHQQIWGQSGTLTFVEGRETHVLEAGDCLQLGAPAPCAFSNRTRRACRYLVAVTRR